MPTYAQMTDAQKDAAERYVREYLLEHDAQRIMQAYKSSDPHEYEDALQAENMGPDIAVWTDEDTGRLMAGSGDSRDYFDAPCDANGVKWFKGATIEAIRNAFETDDEREAREETEALAELQDITVQIYELQMKARALQMTEAVLKRRLRVK